MNWLLVCAAASLGVAALAGLWNAYQFRRLSKSEELGAFGQSPVIVRPSKRALWRADDPFGKLWLHDLQEVLRNLDREAAALRRREARGAQKAVLRSIEAHEDVLRRIIEIQLESGTWKRNTEWRLLINAGSHNRSLWRALADMLSWQHRRV